MAVPALANDDLGRVLARGRAAWPAVTLTAADLAPFLDGASGSAHAEDLYLACACARGHPAAVALFEARVLPQVESALRRLRMADEALAEVRPEIRAHLLAGDAPHIGAYRGHGPLAAWVRIVAVRMALQRQRRDRAARRRGSALAHEPVLTSLDPTLDPGRARHRDAFRAAFADALRALTPSHRGLLQLHLLDERSLAQLGALHGVSKSSAARRVAEARAALEDELRRRLRAELDVVDGELDGLIAAMRRRPELQLERLLADERALARAEEAVAAVVVPAATRGAPDRG